MRLLTDAGEEVRKLDANLKSVKPLLDDAERKDMVDHGVEHWLDHSKKHALTWRMN